MGDFPQNLAPIWNNPYFLGLARCLAGFPFEHPLELAKLSAQSQPHLSSARVITKIYQETGFAGFTNTMVANFPKRSLRELVRWPFIEKVHHHFTSTYPTTFPHEGLSSKILTGLLLALFDSTMLLPIEQFIVQRIETKQQYRQFALQILRNNEYGILYSGFRINLIRQGVVWSSFLAMNHQFKKQLNQWDPDNKYPYALKQGVTSLSIAAIVTGSALPIDFTKYRIQAERPLTKVPITSVVKILHQRYGIRGFYAGLLPVFLHSTFQATVKGILADLLMSKKQ